jgi:transposase
MTIIPELFDQDLQILQVAVADEITLTLRATSPTAVCPDCGTIATRIHSQYTRTVHDLPNRRCPVHLVLQVRRFRCQRSTCARKIFAEQFPTLTRPYAQRTLQLQEALCHLGIALGGQAGTLLGSQLGIAGSRDTILRLIRKTELPARMAPKKIGIDDWAWKRGHRYGTLVCDLERGIPIDLLPDRSVETVTTWFQNHPTINLISRDRASEYALAARKGAPQAVQVADRWHVMKNLGEALEVLLAHHLTISRKRKTQEVALRQASVIPQGLPAKRSSQQGRIQQIHREERLAKYEQVLSLLKQGMTRQAIAEQVGVGLTTIQNWLLAGSFPERKPREQSSQLDPYRLYIEKRWSEGYHNLMGIYRELQAQGYQGSYENIRARFVDASPRTRTKLVASIPPPPVFPSKRRAVWLFLRRPEDLTGEEQEIILRLRDLHPDIDLAYLFVQQFAQMVRMRTGEKLDAWLLAVASSPLVDFRSFVKSVTEDKEAIFAGLTREESNGPTEGHITRLKLIKRSMYGRANFDLLRVRVLSPSHKKIKTQKTKMRDVNKQKKKKTHKLGDGDTNTPNSQHTTTLISEVA